MKWVSDQTRSASKCAVANGLYQHMFPVIATKYTTAFVPQNGDARIKINLNGCGTKSLQASVAASLQKLQTHYIDLVRRIEPSILTEVTERTVFYSSMSTGGTTVHQYQK